MKQGLTVTDSLQQLKGIVRKTHYIVLFLFIAAIIGVTTLTVTSLLSLSTPQQTPASSTNQKSAFTAEAGTISRIETLDFSTDSSEVTLPNNLRINPFAE